MASQYNVSGKWRENKYGQNIWCTGEISLNYRFGTGIQTKIAELKPGMQRINVAAKVVEMYGSKDITSRSGQRMKVATSIVNDESGSVTLTLWNEQIDEVHVDSVIKIENGYVTSVNGEMCLHVRNGGKLIVESNAG